MLSWQLRLFLNADEQLSTHIQYVSSEPSWQQRRNLKDKEYIWMANEMDINELYQELIIDHGTEPRNYHTLPNPTNTAEGFNPLCGDKIKIYLQIENDLITNASFVGAGCAISTASASIMSEILLNKTTAQAFTLIDNFKDLVTGHGHTNGQENLGKLLALAGVKSFPSRIKCATLAWHTLDAALRHKHETASTE